MNADSEWKRRGFSPVRLFDTGGTRPSDATLGDDGAHEVARQRERALVSACVLHAEHERACAYQARYPFFGTETLRLMMENRVSPAPLHRTFTIYSGEPAGVAACLRPCGDRSGGHQACGTPNAARMSTAHERREGTNRTSLCDDRPADYLG